MSRTKCLVNLSCRSRSLTPGRCSPLTSLVQRSAQKQGRRGSFPLCPISNKPVVPATAGFKRLNHKLSSANFSSCRLAPLTNSPFVYEPQGTNKSCFLSPLYHCRISVSSSSQSTFSRNEIFFPSSQRLVATQDNRRKQLRSRLLSLQTASPKDYNPDLLGHRELWRARTDSLRQLKTVEINDIPYSDTSLSNLSPTNKSFWRKFYGNAADAPTTAALQGVPARPSIFITPVVCSDCPGVPWSDIDDPFTCNSGSLTPSPTKYNAVLNEQSLNLLSTKFSNIEVGGVSENTAHYSSVNRIHKSREENVPGREGHETGIEILYSRSQTMSKIKFRPDETKSVLKEKSNTNKRPHYNEIQTPRGNENQYVLKVPSSEIKHFEKSDGNSDTCQKTSIINVLRGGKENSLRQRKRDQSKDTLLTAAPPRKSVHLVSASLLFSGERHKQTTEDRNVTWLHSPGNRQSTTGSSSEPTSQEQNNCRLLGRGAFGRVLLIKKNGRDVAVKILHDRRPTVGELLARRLRHPHVLGVTAIYGVRELGCLVEMTYGGNSNLLSLINNTGEPLNLDQALRYWYHISLALEYCHGEGVMHLDVKPANIIVSDDRTNAKLADFGSAKSVNDDTHMAKSVAGTVHYMAPELFCGHRPRCSADIYSMAVTAWHAIGGHAPYEGVSTDAVIYQVVAKRRRPQPKLPRVLARWQTLIDECWSHLPGQRPPASKLTEILESSCR